MIDALHHIQLAIPEHAEETARRFYCDILGFKELTKPAELSGRGGIWLRSGSVDLHLGVETPFAPARKAHPGLQVASLGGLIDHLCAHKIPYRRDIDLPDIRRLYIDDPFGNRLELLEVIDNTPTI